MKNFLLKVIISLFMKLFSQRELISKIVEQIYKGKHVAFFIFENEEEMNDMINNSCQEEFINDNIEEEPMELEKDIPKKYIN